jgi:PAS domain S-box-containing protein
MAGAPAASVLMFDVDLRVTFAEGNAFRQVGVLPESLEGRLLAELLSADSWARLRGDYTGALAGRSGTVQFASRGTLYSIHVSPLTDHGTIVGALTIAQAVDEHRDLESQLRDQENIVRASDRLLTTAFDHAPIGMSVIDLEGRWLRVNEAYCRMLGYREEELLDKTFIDLTHPDDVAADLEWSSAAALGAASSYQREKRYVARDGATVWVDAQAEMVRDDSGVPSYIVSMLQDITARRGADLALRTSEQRLRAILDNTPNAVSVQDRDYRYQLVNRSFEQRVSLTSELILGRLDHEVLPAASVAADRESHDQVLRTGELVELEEVVPRDDGDSVFRTVKFALRDERSEIAGVCAIVNDISDRKRRETELAERLKWTDRIHSAVAQNLLVLHAQPILNLRSREIEQRELLVRMLEREDSTALISPGEFLPAAERFELIGVIDRWVVARAVELARHQRVEINLSGITISDPLEIAAIERLVLESGAAPGNIVFEITETAAVQDVQSARRFAERLRALGCLFALDDFGVGFGTFTYLKHLPVDYLKIDIEFVRDMVRNDADRHVVRAVVSVAQDFGMKTIAEGVEDEATLELLATMGVDYAQGYWIGRAGAIQGAPARAGTT